MAGPCCAPPRSAAPSGGRADDAPSCSVSRSSAGEDPRLVTGAAATSTTSATDALAVAFVRSPHAHARIVDIDVDRRARRRRAGRDLHLRGPAARRAEGSAVAEPLPLLIPHPALTHPRTGVRAGPRRGQPRRRAGRDGGRHRPVRGRGRGRADPWSTTTAARRWSGVGQRAPRRAHGARRRPGQRRRPPGPGGRRRRRGDRRRAAHAGARPGRRAQRLDADGGQGRATRAGTPPTARMRVYSSTQTSTSVRAAVAAKLGLPLGQVEVVAPDVGGGFGVKIVHPWPEEVLVPWAARRLGREVKWTEDRREHFVSVGARARPGAGRSRSASTTTGRMLGAGRRVLARQRRLHAVRRSSSRSSPRPSCSARTSRAPTGCEFWSLYTNTVIVTPYRGAGRPQGVFAMERTMDAIADDLGLDRAEVRVRNFIQPDEMPYDHGLTLPGRPAADLRLRRLPGVAGEAQGAGRLGRLRRPYRRRPRAEGRRVGIGLACYVEGTGVGPYEGAPRRGRDRPAGSRSPPA